MPVMAGFMITNPSLLDATNRIVISTNNKTY